MAVSLALTLFSLALPAFAASNSTSCADGVHIIVARGSNEPSGTGSMGAVANAVANSIPGSNVQGLDYPATFNGYADSVADGVEALTSDLEEYSDACPDSKVVLMGYSQGAHVTLDTLCGRTDDENGGVSFVFDFEDSSPVDATIVNSTVLAVVLFGDPSHEPDAPWNRGNSTSNGLFPRRNITACEPYEAEIRSWCDEGDTYCDTGNNRQVHGSYVGSYEDDAVSFVMDRWEELDGDGQGEDDDDEGDDGESQGDDDSAAGTARLGFKLMGASVLVSFVTSLTI